jgi:subtilase family serine protease
VVDQRPEPASGLCLVEREHKGGTMISSSTSSAAVCLAATLSLGVSTTSCADLQTGDRAAAALPELIPNIVAAPDEAPSADAGPLPCNDPKTMRTSHLLHCYEPGDIYAAYGVDKLHMAGLTGKGQTIVIVDPYGSPTAQEDFDIFSATFGLPSQTLTIIRPSGSPTFSPAMNDVQLGWAEETSLDIQWAHAIAPDAEIVLIATNPAETEGVQGFPGIFKGLDYAVEHFPGAVVSQSFATTEQAFHSAADVQVKRFRQTYQAAADNHITVLSASGDFGTANIDKQGNTFPFPTVQWPASDPLVTAAGGTWLQYGWLWNPSGTDPFGFITEPGLRTEAVWNEPYLPAATGGGTSALFGTPDFQMGLPSSLLQGARGVPDLSWNAAVNGGVLTSTTFRPGAATNVNVAWTIFGGTSAAAPQLAGLIAIANQLADQTGKRHVGYLNPLLYQLPASDFEDIVPQTFGTGTGTTTLDNNQLGGSTVPGFETTVGYDLTTGRGTPKSFDFVMDLVDALPRP